MRIRIIFPGLNANFHTKQDIKFLEHDDIHIDIVHSDVGPDSISSRAEEVLAIPGTLQKIVAAEKAGIDAVVIDCMGDPGVAQGRELVSIPVVGPSQTAMSVAATLGDRFAVITMAEAVNPLVRQQARAYFLEEKLCATLSVEIPPKELKCNLELTADAIYHQAKVAIKNYGADTIIFGCCGMLGCQENVKARLLKEGLNVQIIDPLPLAVYFAEMLIRSHLSQSKKAYGHTSLKSYPGLEFLNNLD
jgi:allantoin racemase